VSDSGWAAYRRSGPNCEHLARRVEATAPSGSALRIDAVEVYEDAIKVFWSDPRLTERDRSIARPLALDDDLGTQYTARGGSHSTGPDIVGEVGVVIFQPTPPPPARVLRLLEPDSSAATISLT
jgi:hypothetical protein